MIRKDVHHITTAEEYFEFLKCQQSSISYLITYRWRGPQF
jgi:hypothetical protein